MKYIVRTLICPDGVIGINGWQYLLDKKDNVLHFNSIKSATQYLMDNGYSKEFIDEWIEIKSKELT
jgi:hypothetical protein